MLTSRVSPSADTALKGSMQDLSRLLSRIQHQVFGASTWTDGDTVSEDLQRSVYLRRKTGANIEHARTLLLRLERDVSTIKTPRRSDYAATLRAHRATIAQLNRTLIALDAVEPDSDQDEPTLISSTSPPTPAAATTPTTSLLRARQPLPQTTDTATTTSLQTREATLTSHAAEQETIKASLVSLASALKASNMDFSRALAEEKGVLDAAVSGLDKNALGLESAERKMGTLQRMTGGTGWFGWSGQIVLYVKIGVLWLVMFLLVFVGPKLRF